MPEVELAIGVRGIEPPTYASQKHRATSALHPVNRFLSPLLLNLQGEHRSGFYPLINYNSTYVLCQMVPSVPIHTYERDPFQ